MPINMEEIEARALAATPGPWADDETHGLVTAAVHNEDGDYAEVLASYSSLGAAAVDANWHFVCNARDDVPALIAHIRELERDKTRLDWLEQSLADIRVLLDGSTPRTMLVLEESIIERNTLRECIDEAMRQQGSK